MPIYKTRCLKCQMVLEDYYHYVDGFKNKCCPTCGSILWELMAVPSSWTWGKWKDAVGQATGATKKEGKDGAGGTEKEKS